VEDNLCIRSGPEGVPEAFELKSQFLEIVNFAVVSDGVLPIRSNHGLMPGGTEVNNGKPTMAHAHKAVHIETFAVRTAVSDGICHPPQECWGDRLAIQVKYKGNSAHGLIKGIRYKV